MSPADQNAKDRILDATLAILGEVDDPAAITVRQIAERAEVSLGSINYYFGGKDTLLSEAVGRVLMVEASRWFADAADTATDPVTRLRMLLKETSRVSMQYVSMMQIMLLHSLQQGDVSVPVMLLPLLREIFKDRRSDSELRMVALQLIIPLQASVLNPSAYRNYTGYDLTDDRQRNTLIDHLIDNLVR